MGEARIVLPIQPGTHWSDAKPMVLPGGGPGGGQMMESPHPKPLPVGEGEGGGEGEKAKRAGRARKPKVKQQPPPPPNPISASGGLWFAPPTPTAPPTPPPPSPEELKAAKAAEQKQKPKREKQKNDPKLVAAAREFRDRYLDEVNSADGRRLLESTRGAGGGGKYDVSRQLAHHAEGLPGRSLGELRPMRLPMLEAA
jgi:hypothetical protein